MMFDEEAISTPPFISLIYRRHARYINEILKEDDLSFGLHPLLVKVYKEDGISQEELAKFFQLSESTITRNVKKLESKGVIERINDKRKKILNVTPKGEKIAEKILNYDEKWDEKIKQSMSNDEYDNFLKILKKICVDLI